MKAIIHLLENDEIFTMPNIHTIKAGKHRISRIEIDHEQKTCSYIFSLPPDSDLPKSKEKVKKHLERLFPSIKGEGLKTLSNNEQALEFGFTVSTGEDLKKTSSSLYTYKSYVGKIDKSLIEDMDLLIKFFSLGEGKSTTTDENASEQLKQEIDKGENADTQLITQLIKQGASVNVQGENSGWTAAHLAVQKNDIVLMRLLAKKGADLNLQENSKGRTPLFYAKSAEMVKLLTDEGANFLQRDTSTKTTALRHLINEGLVTADNLLKKEVDKLNHANLDLVQAFIICGANINTQGEQSGWTAAHLAVQKNNLSLINFLIDRQIDLNLSSKLRGNSPLCNVTSVEMARVLLRNNANYMQLNNEKQKAYQMLLTNFADKKEAQDEVKQLLIEQEIKNKNFAAFNPELLQDCAFSESHANQLKELQKLGCLLDEHMAFVQIEKSPQELVNGKLSVYKQLGEQIREAMQKNSLDAQEISGLAYRIDHIEEAKEIKQLLLELEVDKPTFKEVDAEVLQTNASSQVHAEQLQVLQSLGCFIEEQMTRLQKQTSHQKGIDDKVDLYKLLNEQIRTAMKNDSLSSQDLNNLIYQTATISHHRRYRTSNKAIALITFGFYSIEATSWQSYRDFVNQQGASFGDELQQVFQRSLLIREDKIPCILHPKDMTEADIEVQGYEEYRENQLKTR
ncbi:ankyrin repeat domain-containing protein [Legionella brunensis]|uniref:Ankyrin repeats (3 copies) n=1 Tax=Legionella brunensis TaxID=29422 RepID=A0A0W0SDK3_9GAMM|nr:ankyrin repeat domain-containing protein [Legionella brunensis]KTC81458.1 Ankyrin repeats (3 copies) [Legionella brunensis]